uniref:Uncharacterized protein n=1 Tax=Onchocerca volvulus TaxID=6282 RepID=A0A8R1TWP2_ONCVO
MLEKVAGKQYSVIGLSTAYGRGMTGDQKKIIDNGMALMIMVITLSMNNGYSNAIYISYYKHLGITEFESLLLTGSLIVGRSQQYLKSEDANFICHISLLN